MKDRYVITKLIIAKSVKDALLNENKAEIVSICLDEDPENNEFGFNKDE